MSYYEASGYKNKIRNKHVVNIVVPTHLTKCTVELPETLRLDSTTDVYLDQVVDMAGQSAEDYPNRDYNHDSTNYNRGVANLRNFRNFGMSTNKEDNAQTIVIKIDELEIKNISAIADVREEEDQAALAAHNAAQLALTPPGPTIDDPNNLPTPEALGLITGDTNKGAGHKNDIKLEREWYGRVQRYEYYKNASSTLNNAIILHNTKQTKVSDLYAEAYPRCGTVAMPAQEDRSLYAQKLSFGTSDIGGSLPLEGDPPDGTARATLWDVFRGDSGAADSLGTANQAVPGLDRIGVTVHRLNKYNFISTIQPRNITSFNITYGFFKSRILGIGRDFGICSQSTDEPYKFTTDDPPLRSIPKSSSDTWLEEQYSKEKYPGWKNYRGGTLRPLSYDNPGNKYDEARDKDDPTTWVTPDMKFAPEVGRLCITLVFIERDN